MCRSFYTSDSKFKKSQTVRFRSVKHQTVRKIKGGILICQTLVRRFWFFIRQYKESIKIRSVFIKQIPWIDLLRVYLIEGLAPLY